MSTALITFDAMQQMAKTMSASKLFGTKTPDELMSLMLIAQAEGKHPAIVARDYDVIQGRPSKKSEAMLRDFLEAGGTVKWNKLNDTEADATFAHAAGGEVTITWDMKRAAQAGLGSKDMWKKYPRQMLRARCISEGVRTIYPVATSGMYVPEEIQDMGPEKEIGGSSAAPRRRNVRTAAPAEFSAAAGSLDALPAPKESTAPPASVVPSQMGGEAAEVADPGTISAAQKKRLEARIGELNLDREAVKKHCLDSYAKEHFADLSPGEYEHLDKMLDRKAEKAIAAAAPAESERVL